MSWIKDNTFAVALGSATLVGVILISLTGFKGAARYQQAKDDFEAAKDEASGFEALPLYPRPENRDGKGKALEDYRAATESLQAAFERFRPTDLKNVSPQDFTNQLKAVNADVRKAFDDSGTKVPDLFFCGFENYKTSLILGKATGILTYELGGIKTLMLALAQSGASSLQNFYRPSLPEEDGREYAVQESDVARPLPFEMTFSGPEKAVRAFLSAILKQEKHYVIIRSVAVNNSKKDPPRLGDAKFEKPTTKSPSSIDDIFPNGGFVLPGEEPKPADKKAAPTAPTAPRAPTAPTATPAAAAPTVIPATPTAAVLTATPAVTDSSRILTQVLGNEEVQVFLRLDLMQFLPAKKLP